MGLDSRETLKRATELYAEATMKNKIKSTKSSGNVFADLGLPNADQHLIKADIVLAIAARIKAKKLTQAEVSQLIGLAQPDVSKLLRGHFTGYSFERLFGFMTALGDNVKIAISFDVHQIVGRLRHGQRNQRSRIDHKEFEIMGHVSGTSMNGLG